VLIEDSKGCVSNDGSLVQDRASLIYGFATEEQVDKTEEDYKRPASQRRVSSLQTSTRASNKETHGRQASSWAWKDSNS
jgi:hypothetical protein